MGPPIPKGPVYRDKDDKRRQESRNGVVQFEYVSHLALESGSVNGLTSDTLRELQRLAINQIYRCAGHFRDGKVKIKGVDHQPPDHKLVPELVLEMCQYVNRNWHKTAVHLASYVMWRINWIHPFFGGNGQTARAASYLVLCCRLGFPLPGNKTIPELIIANRSKYYGALRSADSAWSDRRLLDLSEMEELIGDLLGAQLVAIHNRATTGQDSPA